jgi:hypothetical protein
VTGGITGSSCSWGIYIQGPDPPGWRSLNSETVKFIVYRTLYIVKDRPVLSSERAPNIKNPQWSDNDKNLIISPRWGLDTEKDWPTDRRS